MHALLSRRPFLATVEASTQYGGEKEPISDLAAPSGQYVGNCLCVFFGIFGKNKVLALHW